MYTSNLNIGSDIYYEYEQVLLGNKKNIASYYFGNTKKEGQKAALVIIKYAIEYFLKWSPQEAEAYFDKNIIKKMKLENIVKYIDFPGVLNPDKDFYYIIHLIYPESVKMDEYELTIKTYHKILNGELKKFPKEYLAEAEGMLRACVCFQNMLIQFYSNEFSSIKDIYYMFSTSDGINALKKYRLYDAYIDIYDNLVDYLHDSLSKNQRNEYFRNFYAFKYALLNNKRI